MWSDLIRPWQACLELAWQAYCDDCYPIGAVVTDADGNVLSRGRNRIYENKTRRGRSPGSELAHAEVEALQTLDYGSLDHHSCILYTTTEPCPMCTGMLYMSGLRTIHYAARDPWAGSLNLLGTTLYMRRKSFKIVGPDPALEPLLVALYTEQDLRFHSGKLPDGLFWEMYAKTFPEGIRAGQSLFEHEDLKAMRKSRLAAGDVFDRLAFIGK
jgi:tRNA(adenine34) deaminase